MLGYRLAFPSVVCGWVEPCPSSIPHASSKPFSSKYGPCLSRALLLQIFLTFPMLGWSHVPSRIPIAWAHACFAKIVLCLVAPSNIHHGWLKLCFSARHVWLAPCSAMCFQFLGRASKYCAHMSRALLLQILPMVGWYVAPRGISLPALPFAPPSNAHGPWETCSFDCFPCLI